MILAMSLSRSRPPTTPGNILLEEFLKPLGLTQAEFADRTGIGPRAVNEICRGKRAITPRTAILFSDEFGTTVDFWLNLQSACDVWSELEKMRRLSDIPRTTITNQKTTLTKKNLSLK